MNTVVIERILLVDCKKCSRSTRHEVLFSHEEESDPEIYHEKDSWEIVRCLGCYNISFRHQNDDYEMVTETGPDEYSHAQTISIFPKVIRNHKGLRNTHFIPTIIRKAYQQTLLAYGEAAFILASIGLRATVEAVCNHLQISGATLEKRIDNLHKSGHVSNADKKRMHAIRFLGNDAAHEIKEPKEADLRIALEIVEHLLNSLFILEKRARKLETVIEDYDEFKKQIEYSVNKIDKGQTMSLVAIVGSKRRLIGQSLPAFEIKLIDDINSGNILFLGLAAKSTTPDGKEVQLYSVVSDPEESEIPF